MLLVFSSFKLTIIVTNQTKSIQLYKLSFFNINHQLKKSKLFKFNIVGVKGTFLHVDLFLKIFNLASSCLYTFCEIKIKFLRY